MGCVTYFKSLKKKKKKKKTLQPSPRGHKGDSRGCNDHLLGGDGLGVGSVLQTPQPLLHGCVSRASLWNIFLIKWLFQFLRSKTMWNPYELEERKLGQQNIPTLFPTGPTGGTPWEVPIIIRSEYLCCVSWWSHQPRTWTEQQVGHGGPGVGCRQEQWIQWQFLFKHFSTSYPEKQPLGSNTQLGSFIYLFFICEKPQNKN